MYHPTGNQNKASVGVPRAVLGSGRGRGRGHGGGGGRGSGKWW